MATWFSHPIAWNSRMTLVTDAENRMRVSSNPGPIDMTALYDGIVIYRPTSVAPAPEKGNVELVLMPGSWPNEIQEFFNPRFPKLAQTSNITELPPGRVVYLNVAKSAIKLSLYKIIFDAFKVFLGDQKKIHRSLDFIPDISPTQLATLKQRLLEAWNSTPVDSERQKKIDAEINNAVDQVLSLSVNDAVLRGLPVQGKDVLCQIGNSTSPAEITFEMRNLYGEPLNPHFYLRKIEKTANELTPTPPFPSGALPPPRFTQPDQALFIRIPKNGGAEYVGMDGSIPTYASPLIWTHNFNSANGSHSTAVANRPGSSVPVPVIDSSVATRVNAIWNTDHVWINKHAEIFQVPCELILATIYKEGQMLPGGTADLHSVRLEKIEPFGPYPVDYEDLIAKSKTPGSLLTKAAIEAYWTLAGFVATNPDGLDREPRTNVVDPSDLPKLNPPLPFQGTAKLGTSEALKEITWAQLAEMYQLKDELVETVSMKLPVLGKTSTKKYHYDLIKDAPELGLDVARIYWEVVGGLRLNAGKEELSNQPEQTFISYPLSVPANKDWPALLDPNDATRFINWEQLLVLLNLLSRNGMKNVPKATYILKPLQQLGNYAYETLFARPQLVRLLGISDDQAGQIMLRYFALMEKSLLFVPLVGPAPGQPGVQRKDSPNPEEYLTLPELIAMSRIYPGRISIGVGQILLDTAARKVIPWIKTHYGREYFEDVLQVPNPPSSPEALVPWTWEHVWDNEEFQVALIAAYHKENATIFWQPCKDPRKNKYRVGENMTMFDFPRVGAAYNAGIVKKPTLPRAGNPDVDWGLHTFSDYLAPMWSAIKSAVDRFDSMPPTDPKWARVRLRPDIETQAGMDPR